MSFSDHINKFAVINNTTKEMFKTNDMKCTLRQVAEGIVATVDERPKKGEWACSENVQNWNPFKAEWNLSNPNGMLCIASTIPKVGKELKFSKYGKVLTGGVTTVNFGTEYPYTETETQIIIEL